MTQVFLIRHGATSANLDRPYWLQGAKRDPSLAPLGVQQAERVAELLQLQPLAAVYSSPLARARETARHVAQMRNLAVQVEEDLREGDVGRWEGKTYEQIQKDDAQAFACFEADPEGYGYPDGETFAAIRARVVPCMSAIAARHEQQAVAVVTHQIVLRVYLGTLLGLEGGLSRRLRTANGGVAVVEFGPHGPLVVTLNSCFHLAGVATPP